MKWFLRLYNRRQIQAARQSLHEHRRKLKVWRVYLRKYREKKIRGARMALSHIQEHQTEILKLEARIRALGGEL